MEGEGRSRVEGGPAVGVPVDNEVRNVIIIGSGPAGYTAGLYAARALLNPLMFAGYMSGGQLMLTSDVENFPGYPAGIGGPDMMVHMREQAERFGLEIQDRNVERVDFSERPFGVWVEGEEHRAEAVIICTGAEAIWLGVDGEDEHKGRGISTCATCDGAFFKEQDVIVVGGGDSAMEEAIFLTRFASKVSIVHRREGFRASKVMYERAVSHPKIEIRTHRRVKRWLSDENGLSGAILEDPRDGNEEEIFCTGAFIAIGHKPMTGFLDGEVEKDDSGYILHFEHTMTSVPGVFAAGDVVDKRYRQAITAAGMGCEAAMDAEKWLEDQH